jgi:2-polyprenyl-6-methoxyphenol hydroxylase-like FAD-dependent oxidoreductase
MAVRAVIIGAGIGGLTTAVALARRGIRAEVYEQASQLREVGAGAGLWPNAFRALVPLGLYDDARALTVRPEKVGFRRFDGRWIFCQPMEVWPHHRGEAAPLELDVDAIQRTNDEVALTVSLGEVDGAGRR